MLVLVRFAIFVRVRPMWPSTFWFLAAVLEFGVAPALSLEASTVIVKVDRTWKGAIRDSRFPHFCMHTFEDLLKLKHCSDSFMHVYNNICICAGWDLSVLRRAPHHQTARCSRECRSNILTPPTVSGPFRCGCNLDWHDRSWIQTLSANGADFDEPIPPWAK